MISARNILQRNNVHFFKKNFLMQGISHDKEKKPITLLYTLKRTNNFIDRQNAILSNFLDKNKCLDLLSYVHHYILAYNRDDRYSITLTVYIETHLITRIRKIFTLLERMFLTVVTVHRRNQCI